VAHKIICSDNPESTDFLNVDAVSKIRGPKDDSGYPRISRRVYDDCKGEIYTSCKRDRERPECEDLLEILSDDALILYVRDCDDILSTEKVLFAPK